MMSLTKKDILDIIIYKEYNTIKNIPEKVYEYILHGRLVTEWIIYQYRVKTEINYYGKYENIGTNWWVTGFWSDRILKRMCMNGGWKRKKCWNIWNCQK